MEEKVHRLTSLPANGTRKWILCEPTSTKPQQDKEMGWFKEMTRQIQGMQSSDGEAPTPTIQDFKESSQGVSEAIWRAFRSSTACRQSLIPTLTSAKIQDSSGLPREYSQVIPCGCRKKQPMESQDMPQSLLLSHSIRTWNTSSLIESFEEGAYWRTTSTWWNGGTSPRAKQYGNAKTTYGNLQNMSKGISTRTGRGRREHKWGRIVTSCSNLPPTEANSAHTSTFNKSPPRSGVHLALKVGCA